MRKFPPEPSAHLSSTRGSASGTSGFCCSSSLSLDDEEVLELLDDDWDGDGVLDRFSTEASGKDCAFCLAAYPQQSRQASETHMDGNIPVSSSSECENRLKCCLSCLRDCPEKSWSDHQPSVTVPRYTPVQPVELDKPIL